jgi:purine nucleosidase
MGAEKGKKGRFIILDVDTGTDDALALLLLVPKISSRIIGITTCGGNTSVANTTRNTSAVLRFLGADIPVYRGSARSLTGRKFSYAHDFHGERGFGGRVLPSGKPSEKMPAHEFIAASAARFGESLALVSVAPPTNIAKAIESFPKLPRLVKDVYLMGGAVHVPGNATPKAEFNFWQDPEAAALVMESFPRVHFVPLDATHKCFITRADLARFKKNSRRAALARDIIEDWFVRFGIPRKRNYELYDPLAVSFLLKKFLHFRTICLKVGTEGVLRGALIPDSKQVKWGTVAKGRLFTEFFIDSLNQPSVCDS